MKGKFASRATGCALTLALLTLPVYSAESGTPNVQEKVSGIQARQSAEAVEKLGMAYKLERIGVSTKSPWPLLAAAEILGTTSVAELNVKPVAKQDAGAPEGVTVPKKETALAPPSVDSLLALATEVSGNDPAVQDAANQIRRQAQQTRGAYGGAKYAWNKVNPYTSDSYAVYFRGGEVARVALRGDGDTDLDLYVYDDNGYLIMRDENPYDLGLVEWVPRWNATYTIVVRNRGPVYNQYAVVTN